MGNRQVRAFSSSIRVSPNSRARDTYSSIPNHGSSPKIDLKFEVGVDREVLTFATPAMIKLMVTEMKKPINIRFLRLIRSCKTYVKTVKKYEDMEALKKIIVKELSYILSEYADMLAMSPGLQLNTYLKLSSILPTTVSAARELSIIMIRSSKIKASTGMLPMKNQKELTLGMDNFISEIIKALMEKVTLDPKSITAL